MFTRTINELAYGQAVNEYNEALDELIKAVLAHQKAGTFQLTLKVIPHGAHVEQLTIEDSYKTVTPQADRMKTIMFVQRDGTIGRRDPRQPELPFHAVEKSDLGTSNEEAI